MTRIPLLFAFVTLAALIPASSCLSGEYIFPEYFRWGTAVAAYQVEGGIFNNDWYHFEQRPGAIANGEKCGAACEHWTRYEQDHQLAADLGNKIFRTSIEWARIEPREGEFDPEALAHYRKMIVSMREKGLEPFITCMHFCFPEWIEGGWSNKRSPELFERFATYLAKNLGDIVDVWTTHNEPMGYLAAGYLDDYWAPGLKNPIKYWNGLRNTIRAHALAYRAIKANDTVDADEDGKAALVGLVKNYTIIAPLNPKNFVNRALAEKVNYLQNHLLLDVLTDRRDHLDKAGFKSGLGDFFRGLFLPEAKGTLDYLGINYYTRFYLRLSIKDPLVGVQDISREINGRPRQADIDLGPVNDLGWPIYPEGLYQVMMAVKSYNLPIYITENGIPDKAGDKRAKFLTDHLIQLHRSIVDGADVRGYIHWSLIDNFEWAEGFDPRFGLYRIDFATQERTLTPGGAFYGEVCRSNGLTAAMVDAIYPPNRLSEGVDAETPVLSEEQILRRLEEKR